VSAVKLTPDEVRAVASTIAAIVVNGAITDGLVVQADVPNVTDTTWTKIVATLEDIGLGLHADALAAAWRAAGRPKDIDPEDGSPLLRALLKRAGVR
jgi:hypothetical protein